jgi:hypothetical protein
MTTLSYLEHWSATMFVVATTCSPCGFDRPIKGS